MRKHSLASHLLLYDSLKHLLVTPPNFPVFGDIVGQEFLKSAISLPKPRRYFF